MYRKIYRLTGLYRGAAIGYPIGAVHKDNPNHMNASLGDGADTSQGAGSSSSMSIGAVLRLMFLSGASDDVVTRFVALHHNAMAANPLPPIVELGPALAQAAQSAGVEVARGLLSQFNAVKSAQPSGALHHANVEASKSTTKASTPKSQRKDDIYRFSVAAGRTSVSLPPDLLAAARQAFGEPALTKMVQKLYGQAVVTKKTGPSTGSVRKVNRSAFVRDALAQELFTTSRIQPGWVNELNSNGSLQ